MSKNIILSFDYELFFGDNPGTVEQSLLKPTNLLLNALDSIHAKATFFVDYLMLKYMMTQNDQTKHDACMIISQLKEIIRRNHRIELHIHPHWVDATYKNGNWDFSNFSHYCLKSFKQNEITAFFIEGKNYLESIARTVKPDYKIVAFRAGGWAILPFSLMKEGFRTAGIKVDSSIICNQIINANGYNLDFTNVPQQFFYRFSDDITKQDSNGEFCEMQIGSFRHSIASTILNIAYHKYFPEMFTTMTDGTHFRRNDIKTENNRLSKWALFHQRQMFGLQGLPSFLLNYKIRKQKQQYVVLISHPKDLKPIILKNIKGLRNFDFYTYYDIVSGSNN